MNIDNILLDLEVIKQLNENDKLAVCNLPGSTKLYVDSYSLISPITRWKNGYTRETTISYLYGLVDLIEKATNKIIDGDHDEYSKKLKSSINNAIPGLNNLKQTYITDSVINGKLTLLINKLTSVNDLLDSYANPSLNLLKECENNNYEINYDDSND